MVDDLTKKGLEEPYRLFTSRAEHRLLLGVDTVLPRLAPHARRLGLLGEEEYGMAMESENRLRRAERELRDRVLTPNRATKRLLQEALSVEIDERVSIYKLLSRNDLDARRIASLAPEVFGALSGEELDVLQTRARYEGYIRRENERLERLRPFHSRAIPEGFVYEEIAGLSREVVEICSRRRPRTIGEASRISGVTPAAVAIISAHVSRHGGAARGGRLRETSPA
jgi:tRNA uridine 5-carboxymethylaminomethyl modification enzyme